MSVYSQRFLSVVIDAAIYLSVVLCTNIISESLFLMTASL